MSNFVSIIVQQWRNHLNFIHSLSVILCTHACFQKIGFPVISETCLTRCLLWWWPMLTWTLAVECKDITAAIKMTEGKKKKTCKLELFVPVYLSSAANRHCFFAPRQHSPSFSSYRCLLFLCPAQPVCPHILWHRHTLSHDCMSFGEMEGGGDYWNDEKFGITGFLACFNSNVCICLQMHKVLLKTI